MNIFKTIDETYKNDRPSNGHWITIDTKHGKIRPNVSLFRKLFEETRGVKFHFVVQDFDEFKKGDLYLESTTEKAIIGSGKNQHNFAFQSKKAAKEIANHIKCDRQSFALVVCSEPITKFGKEYYQVILKPF